LAFFGRFTGGLNRDDDEIGKKIIESAPSHLIKPLISKILDEDEDDDNSMFIQNSQDEKFDKLMKAK
jgi:hypothetical protein